MSNKTNSYCEWCDDHQLHYGDVRVLPTGKMSNSILCHDCFIIEMRWRRQMNGRLAEATKFGLPRWEELKVYKV